MSYFPIYDLPQLRENDYGQEELWAKLRAGGADFSQIAKELYCFRMVGKKPGMLSRYEHGLNLIRMLWPDRIHLKVDWTDYRTGEKVTIYNHCFLDIFKACCEGQRIGLTGAGATGKTFAVSVYAILMFMSDPENTTIFVSTTASMDAERRVWGDIKSLHADASKVFQIGTCIEYLKCVTFDPGREIEGGKSVEQRDLRNGIILIPIPLGEEGQKAVGKIIGTHQKKLIWIIDELPHMMSQILASEANLMKNKFYQLIGIGNANLKTDPHGALCKPRAGWNSISVNSREWQSDSGAKILFLHGERTPNYHPAVDISDEDTDNYPFPYLSSEAMNRRIALSFGRMNLEIGRKTVEYMRFGIGFWKGDDVSNRILSADFVQQHKADEDDVIWDDDGYIVLCGGDFGFVSGGDKNEAMFAKLGRDIDGNQRLVVDPETTEFTSDIVDRVGFRKQIAAKYVAECRSRGVKPEHFGCDVNADGGLMMKEIMKEWESTEIVGLSSLEPSTDKRYANIVTQYWMNTVDAIATGNVRGFNTNSRYSADLFERTFSSVGKGVVTIEKKVEMKKRIKRSPDCGDAFCYMIQMAIRHGFDMTLDIKKNSGWDDDDDLDAISHPREFYKRRGEYRSLEMSISEDEGYCDR